jgi:transcriptional regulator with XRE-family HTH domain
LQILSVKSEQDATRTKVRVRLESRTIALLNDGRNVEVGKRIREARRYAGLSQAALARQLGVTEKAMQNWEYGMTQASRPRLEAIAKATKVPGGWLWLYGSVAAVPTGSEEITALRDQVEESGRRVAELEAAVERLTELVERLGGE